VPGPRLNPPEAWSPYHIWTGAGNDHVYLVYGHGDVHCGAGHKTLTMRKVAANRHWKLIGCKNKTIVTHAA